MKLHFEDDLDYQKAAIDSVVDLFRGQKSFVSEFIVKIHRKKADNGALDYSEIRFANKLELNEDELLENLHSTQLKNSLIPDDRLNSRDFTIEMETGTGKTYVYLRTIMELYKNYEFTKFVIVVPSVAIIEGTMKTLEITKDHFEALYPMAKGYNFFQYDSKKTGQISSFANSSKIQIMVMTVGAINKEDVNNFYKIHEDLNDEKPIDLIKETCPIIIVDEPQSVDGGLNGKGKEALDAMKPLCTLRYSATHIHKHHMLYRLDAVDAYNSNLVKKIEVSSIEEINSFNTPYVRLIETKYSRNSIIAKIEVDMKNNGTAKKTIRAVQDGEDLQEFTGRSIYKDMRIGIINCGPDNKTMEIKGPNIDKTLEIGEAVGGANFDYIKRAMIARTIKEHLDKERKFANQKPRIKVLSLFFIDKVEHYRSYDENGQEVTGKYAQMFEEEYKKLANVDKYNTLFNKIDPDNVAEIHDGYFSIDKKKRWSDTADNNQQNRDNAERAYNLIMREKEKLLNIDNELRFIFSHSALREGWDNPNVFQICSLREMGTERQRRQTLGRGLRLCVNQEGLRLRDNNINILTVIASESYEEFAENLQSEIENETGIRFGLVEWQQFKIIQTKNQNGNMVSIGDEASKKIWQFLNDEGLVDSFGTIQDHLKEILNDGTFKLPSEFAEHRDAVIGILKKLTGKIKINNAKERQKINLKEEIFLDDNFLQLWERIKYKTTYRVNFNNQKLITDAIKNIKESPEITKPSIRNRTAEIKMDESGVSAEGISASRPEVIHDSNFELPDILTDLEAKTLLTRKSIVKILIGSDRLYEFKRNPEQFIEMITQEINIAKRTALVDGVKYQKIEGEEYYYQEIFNAEELIGYLHNTMDTKKSVHDKTIYDSVSVEKKFAEDLDDHPAVKLYAKLPPQFKIPTPLGTYNPDWAIVVEYEGKIKLYFVVETKGSTDMIDLRGSEKAKILCGKKHFEVIATNKNSAKFKVVKTLKELGI